MAKKVFTILRSKMMFIKTYIFFSDLGLGDERKKRSENDQLTGDFQSFFYCFFNISRTNSKTIKVHQQSVLNL